MKYYFTDLNCNICNHNVSAKSAEELLLTNEYAVTCPACNNQIFFKGDLKQELKDNIDAPQIMFVAKI